MQSNPSWRASALAEDTIERMLAVLFAMARLAITFIMRDDKALSKTTSRNVFGNAPNKLRFLRVFAAHRLDQSKEHCNTPL